MRALAVILAAALLAGCAAGSSGTLGETEAAQDWQQPSLAAAGRLGEQPRASSFAGVPLPAEESYTRETLRRNFLSIALRAEAADDSDAAGDIAIAKWTAPLRYRLIGARPGDSRQVATLTRRLSRLTGLDIAPATGPQRPNVVLRFVRRPARQRVVRDLGGARALGPRVGRLVTRWRDGEREKCLGLIAVDPRTGAIAASEILIKDELHPELRKACIVEEIVQSLGLMNDDPTARPSIFNDDQQYLELTSHDEYLLRILYDPRIRPGMTRRAVVPQLRRILDDLQPGARA